jgi:ATP-dependent exoDNAse (exonuclease V) beta subunit
MRYTPEQEDVLAIRIGPHIVCANAGTGKTESLSELFVRLYLAEEKKQYPNLKEGEHISGEDQVKMLGNFFTVTFTVKAAAELDHRIKSKFAKVGVPSPVGKEGSPVTICRTLDSWLQRWFRKPMFFSAWEKGTGAAGWVKAVKAMDEHLHPEIKKLIQAKVRNSRTAAIMGMWEMMLVDPMKSMILDAIIAMNESKDGTAPAWAGWSVEGWHRFLSEYTGGANPRRLGGDYWQPFLTAYKKDIEFHRHKAQRVLQRSTNATHTAEELVEQAESQETERLQNKRNEFGTIFEIARSRSYIPGEKYDAFNSEEFLEVIAMSDNWETLREFDRIARAYHDFKRKFVMMDHGDFLYEFIATIQANSFLLEKDKEYPRIIRHKYVLWDEVQDNSSFQGKILRAFSPFVGIPYCKVIVGDFKQSIHLWRGANPFEFTRQIKDVKARMPNNLHSLTISFRSSKNIVALGNTIVSTLPSYKDLVNPSSTVHAEPGVIRCAPLFQTQEEEGYWVSAEVKRLIEANAGSICVLARSTPDAHPVAKLLKEFGEKVTLMTMHRSKGLEADHVFVLGCTAGRVPDVRGDYDQEVNLWYVACTRARRNVTFCSVIMERVENAEGVVEEKLAGPSPYFWNVPMLKEAALAGGWTEKMLQTGVKTSNMKLAQNLQARESAMAELVREANEITKGTHIDKLERVYEEGTTAPKEAGFQLNFDADGANSSRPQRTEAAIQAEEKGSQKVIKKLKEGFFRNGGVPDLDTDAYQIAVSKGWIHRDSSHWRVTETFRKEFLQPKKG